MLRLTLTTADIVLWRQLCPAKDVPLDDDDDDDDIVHRYLSDMAATLFS